MTKTLIAMLTVLAASIMPAHAEDKPPIFVETRSIPNKPGFVINPAKGYVLLRSDLGSSLFLNRLPSAEDARIYEAYRMREFENARAEYPKKLKRYEEQLANARRDKRALPVKPIEPNPETFQATPFEMLSMVSIGPLFRFAKSKEAGSTYLQELSPGEYRIYGPILISPAGPAGACFCMGSVKFEVKAGEITDIGAILSSELRTERPTEGDSTTPHLGPQNFLVPAPPTLPLDPRLAGMPIRRADFYPVGKTPNYYGIVVGRIPAIPGVIAYERDRIIDLTGGKPGSR